MNLRKIVGSFARFHKLHGEHIRDIMENEGLFYGQLPILECVKQHKSCTQKQISEYLEISAPCVATSVKRLEKKGYLEKVSCQEDQRVTWISLTEKGLEKTNKCRSQFDELDSKVFSVLSDEEKHQLAYMMEKLIQHLEVEDND